jgi:glycogen debranching enzyme
MLPSAHDAPPPQARPGAAARGAREPWLVDCVVAVRAPALAMAGRDGQIRPRDADGFPTAHGHYDQDRRVLSRSELTVDGRRPEYLGHRLLDARRSKHVSGVRTGLDPTPDPVLIVERVHEAGVGESIAIANHDAAPRRLVVRLHVDADLADVSEVRRGQPGPARRPRAHGALLVWTDAADGTCVALRTEPPAEFREPADPRAAGAEPASGTVLGWTATIPAGGRWSVRVLLDTEPSAQVPHPLVRAEGAVRWTRVPGTDDARLDAVLAHGLDDLAALLLAPAARPHEVFAAAGAPWYLTLFGRDSLWTARMLLPVDEGCDLAFGTLSALARLQGAKEDPDTDEQRGKILHELRRRTTEHQQGEILPPVYYGSMDATPLFVLLLVEAWRAGMAAERVRALIPHARAALDWMGALSAAAPDGFIRYVALHPGALFNHGWKDSVDAIVAEDGRRASAPVALAEVQAYAIDAACGFAGLLRAVAGEAGNKEAADLEAWAEKLRRAFLHAFEVRAPGREPYFALALDAGGAAVDGLTSNMGHLLGIGILTPEQSATVARHLVSDDLFSGWGLRTRGRTHSRFNPFGYHSGAVWAHDTAIAVRGLALAHAEAAAAGRTQCAEICAQAARRIAHGLLDAAAAFGYRLPEVFGGGTRDPEDAAPLPFPASCRPQAWYAAAGVAVWWALTTIGPGPARPARGRIRARHRPDPAAGW